MAEWRVYEGERSGIYVVEGERFIATAHPREVAEQIARDHNEIARLRELNRSLLTTIEDAVSVGEMQGEDFRLDPWASLKAAAERGVAALAEVDR